MAAGNLARQIVTPTLDGRGRLQWDHNGRYVVPVLSTIIVALALAQRDEVGPAQVAFAAMVILPWIVAILLGRVVLFTRIVLYGVVLGGVVGLLADGTQHDTVPLVLLVMAFDVALVAKTGESATVAACGMAVMTITYSTEVYDHPISWMIGIAIAWAVGAGLRAITVKMLELREAEAELAAQTVAEDRRRVAREVHDVVAHSLSITMLHVTGAREALEHGGDVDDAVQGLRDAERIGRQSLADVRRTVRLLDDGDMGETRPEPGAADIAGLVGDLTAAGVEVSYETSGDLDAITDTTGLGLYRIAQESLANASRHASEAPIVVSLDAEGGLARLRIANPLTNGHSSLDGVEGGGSGLEGMRRRAQTLGGSLRAGPEDSMWIVEVDVPLAAEAT